MNEINRGEVFSNRTLTQLMLPLLFEQLLATTIGMADTIMVSAQSQAAISAVSLVDSINILLIQVFAALATGGAVVASQYLGHQERGRACDSAKQLLLSTTAVSIVIMALSLLFTRPILRMIFQSLDEEVMRYCVIYFILSALSYPFLAIYNAGAALFRSMGNSKISLYVSLLMNVVNIGGNAWTIYGLGWGVAGAGIASLVSRMLGAVIMLVLIRNDSNPIFIKNMRKLEFDGDLIRRILKIGVPNGLENSMFQIGKLLVSGLIATLGTSIIAANAAANTISALANVPGGAISLGMLTVVGQCVGAGEYEQAQQNTKKLMIVTYVMMFITNMTILLFLQPIIGLFRMDAVANAATSDVMYLFIFTAIIFWPFAFALPSALRAAGDAKFTMIVSTLSMWIFRIGFSYLLVCSFGMNLFGVWLAMIIDWVARFIAFYIRFKQGKWRGMRVI